MTAKRLASPSTPSPTATPTACPPTTLADPSGMLSQEPTTVTTTTSVSAVRDVADWAVKSAGTQPSFYPLLLVAVLLCVIGGFGLLVWRIKPLVQEWIAAWRAEQALNRAHADERLKAIREDAQGDNAAQRELAKVQQQAIVERIGERVDRVSGAVEKLTDRTERHGAVLASIAAKIGATVLALAILLTASASVGYVAVLKLAAMPTTLTNAVKGSRSSAWPLTRIGAAIAARRCAYEPAIRTCD